jgi:hypothetical protein
VKCWWSMPVEELVAKACFYSVAEAKACGLSLLRSWWPMPVEVLGAEACFC